MTDEVDYIVLNDVIKMSNVVEVLLEAIPELRNQVSDEERDQPYYVFGRFADFIRRLIEDRERAGNEASLRCAFAVVNRLSDIGGEIENLIVVQIVEALTPTPRLVAAGRELLSARLRGLLTQL